jgi:ABC-2 type transport system ATP-binding protein
MTSNSLLIVENLTKGFGGKQPVLAVNNLSFDLRQGEILGLLGPNGAGKTTTIKMLISTLKPTSGSITYFGKDFFKHRSESLQQIGFASTYTSLPPLLTVQENLDVYARMYGLKRIERQQRITELLDLFRLGELRHSRTTSLSAGQRTRVMLVRAFLGRPRLVLLDEPTASLDPEIAQEIRAFLLLQLEKHGVSILLTSHNMNEVTSMCDRVLFLKNGRNLALDTPENLAASIGSSSLEDYFLHIAKQ